MSNGYKRTIHNHGRKPMNKAEMVTEYLHWRNNKANQFRYSGEDEFSPEAWIQETLMSDALVRINLIKDVLERTDPDPIELASIIHALVYDDLSKPIVIDDPYEDEEELE
jgi:hypothetical protein